MDIGSGKGYPSSALSNFAPHPFTVTWWGATLECNSMEGFLQSLKFKNPAMQKHVATLVGYTAKKKGRDKDWRKSQMLWWDGNAIGRQSTFYQLLLDEAYDALARNTKFRDALLATGDAVLTHSIGKTSPSETVLTRNEFCSRLMKLRERMQKGTL